MQFSVVVLGLVPNATRGKEEKGDGRAGAGGGDK